jgi:uracil-DNA glycosylase
MDYKIPNINEIKLKLFDSLLKSGWNNLKFFINSSDFDKILFQLYSLKQENKRFTPPIKDVFKTFEECTYDNLKVIILAENPYEHLGVANGLAFCCNNTQKIKLDLKNFVKSIYKTVYSELEMPETINPSLSYLTEQGVLLLNTSLTCEIDKKTSHYNIWKEFISYFIDSINTKKENRYKVVDPSTTFIRGLIYTNGKFLIGCSVNFKTPNPIKHSYIAEVDIIAGTLKKHDLEGIKAINDMQIFE